MKHHHILFLTGFLCAFTASAQFHIGGFAGMSNYYGDLNDKFFNQPKPAIGITFNYQVNDRLLVRTGFTYGRLGGADSKGGSEYLETHRNLEFQTPVKELSLIGEMTLFNLENVNMSPYVFAGAAVFHFNPYATSTTGEKVYLQPLGTEGQGLPEYPGKNFYRLTGIAIPMGGGIKFNLSENIRLGIEMGYRKTFSDYIDDVSTDYADANDLLEARGQQSVSFAYRANENPLGRSTYPKKGDMRGNPKKKDSYYFTGVHFTFRLPGSGGNGSNSRRNSHYSDLKCPPVPR